MDEDKKSAYGAKMREFLREISAVLVAKTLVLGPLDRIKLIH
jgi:hypothetical protein